jgi:uncharacterized protein (DUF58 family)
VSLEEERSSTREEARRIAERLRLSFGQQKGIAGNWLGVGLGSSIDYQDHRPFLVGDDPRYLDWKAYARSGQLTMKVYRDEVTPVVDLVVDVSSSMTFDPWKRKRTQELVYFAIESAHRLRASVACHVVSGATVGRVSPEDLGKGAIRFDEERSDGEIPRLDQVPLRPRSLRVLVSDLLFPGDARGLVSHLSARRGQGRIFVPYAQGESDPAWEGNRELVDVESGARRAQRFDQAALIRYRSAYKRHFDLWRDECRRQDVLMARIPSDVDLERALEVDALRQGAVVPWRS